MSAWVDVLAAVGGPAGAGLGYLAGRRGRRAQAGQLEADALVTLSAQVVALTGDVASLAKRLAEAEARASAAEARAAAAERSLVELTARLDRYTQAGEAA